MHEGLKGAYLTPLRVEIELLKPAIDKLWEPSVFGLFTKKEELIDLAVEYSAKDLDKDAGY